MLDNRGFTLVEMLFSLFIISIISLFSLSFQTTKVGEKEIVQAFNEVQSIIEEARTLAITTHRVVSLDIRENSIGYETKEQARALLLPKGIYFSDIKKIHFNKNGTINQGNHMHIGSTTLKYKIVFTVGSGDFYLQQ